MKGAGCSQPGTGRKSRASALSRCAKEREKQQEEESKGLEGCPDCGGLFSVRDPAQRGSGDGAVSRGTPA